ncbi:MAG TPA: TIM barrel protein [Acidimicrobiales bacterium]
MPSVVFGTNNCFAIKRWPEPEEWSAIVSDVGLEYVQFSFDLLDPLMAGDLDAYDRVREVCEQRGISISSAFTGFVAYSQNFLGHPDEALRSRAQEWYRLAISAGARLGVRGVGGHIGAMSVREFEDESQRRRSIQRSQEAVLRLAEHAAKEGLEFLLWEIMPVAREYPAHMDEAEELMSRWTCDAAVPVTLCLDLGHACLAGGTELERDPYAWLERLGPYARTIHLQQTDGVFDRHWPFTQEFNANGIIEPERVVELVNKLPQDEVELMLEPVHAFETPDEQVKSDLRESVLFWRPWVESRSTREGTSDL